MVGREEDELTETAKFTDVSEAFCKRCPTGAKTFENRGFGRAFLHSVPTQRGPRFRGGVQTLPIKIPHQLAPLSNKGTPSIFLFLKWVGCFRV